MKIKTQKGGFGGNVHHDSHLLYTLSAIQVLLLLDRLDSVDVEKTIEHKEKKKKKKNKKIHFSLLFQKFEIRCFQKTKRRWIL